MSSSRLRNERAEYAYKDHVDPIAGPATTTEFQVEPTSISAGLKDEKKRVSIQTESPYKRAILLALVHAQTTEKWMRKRGRTRLLDRRRLGRFAEWLIKNHPCDESPQDFLNAYVAEYLNQSDGKTRVFRGSGASEIMGALRSGITSPFLNAGEKKFIGDLLNSTRKWRDPSTQTSLSDWLALPQVRQSIGDSEFAKLSSPKVLHRSFVATISVTLSLLQEAREALAGHYSAAVSTESGKRPGAYRDHVVGVKTINDIYFGSAAGSTELSKAIRVLFLNSVLPPNIAKNVKRYLSKSDCQEFPNTIHLKPKTHDGLRFFCMPSVLFADDVFSRSEEILVEYLCASLAIQPNSIRKLRIKNFLLLRNMRGRPQSLHCRYYKGRANSYKETRDVSKGEVAFAPLLAHLGERESNKILVPNAPISKPNPVLKNPLIATKTFRQTDTALLSSIWLDDDVKDELISRLKSFNCSPLFLLAFRSIFRADTPSWVVWSHKRELQKKTSSMDEYRATVKYPLPKLWPSLVQVKTTAVHAESDEYRSDDLINHNSHTARTEKLSYLNDTNKEWTNLHGRISRFVQYDISSCVYRPSLMWASREAKTRLAHTIITNSLEIGEVKIDQLGIGTDVESKLTEDTTNYIVVEVPETVVYMLHFLGEAGRAASELQAKNPDFFVQEVLVKVEWLTMLLESMNPVVVQKGQRDYLSLLPVLPRLFTHEAAGGFS